MFQLSCLRVCLSIYHPFIHMSVHTSFSALFTLPCFRVCLSIYHPFIHMPVHISFSVMFQLSYLDPSTIHSSICQYIYPSVLCFNCHTWIHLPSIHPYDSTYIPQCFVSTVMLESMFVHALVYICSSTIHSSICSTYTPQCFVATVMLESMFVHLPSIHLYASTYIFQSNVSTVMLESMFVHLPSIHPYASTYILQCYVSTVILGSIYHPFIHMPVHISFSVMFQLSYLDPSTIHSSICQYIYPSVLCFNCHTWIHLPSIHPYASTYILQCYVSTVILGSIYHPFIHMPVHISFSALFQLSYLDPSTIHSSICQYIYPSVLCFNCHTWIHLPSIHPYDSTYIPQCFVSTVILGSIYNPFIHMTVHTSLSALFQLLCLRICCPSTIHSSICQYIHPSVLCFNCHA